MKMKSNLRIAKTLVKIARMLVAFREDEIVAIKALQTRPER